MKQFLTQFFVALGVIFLIQLIFLVYLFIADPFGLKPLLFGTTAIHQSGNTPSTTKDDKTSSTSSETPTGASGFTLSDAQRQALVGLGLDPASVPSTISPEQEACFVGVLGEARVVEIKNGAVPNAVEFLKAKACI